MRKLAVILDRSSDLCPFGLEINAGCRSAGDSVDRMTPIESSQDFANINSNLAILDKNPEPTRCKYASHIFRHDIVDCSISSIGQSTQRFPVNFEDHVNSGGVFSYPVVYETNSDIYHNPAYGNYTYASRYQIRSIARQVLYELLIAKANIIV